jgi:hypothetical protein
MQHNNSNTYLPPEKYKSSSTLPQYKFQEVLPCSTALVEPNETDPTISYSSNQYYSKENHMTTCEKNSFPKKKDAHIGRIFFFSELTLKKQINFRVSCWNASNSKIS